MLNWPRAVALGIIGLILGAATLPVAALWAPNWTAFVTGTPLGTSGTAALLTIGGLPALLLGFGYLVMVMCNAWPKR